METRLSLPILRNCRTKSTTANHSALAVVCVLGLAHPQECVIGYEPISAVYCLRLYLQLS